MTRPIYLGYARLSRIDAKDRRETESTDRQVARLTAWAREQDIELELFAEPDGVRSGGSIQHRPAYQQMLARLLHARPGELAGVVATDLDRAGRLERDMHALFDQIVSRGLRLIVLDDPSLNLESTDGRFLVGLKVLLAAQERRKISDRVKTALQHRMSQGLYCGRTPYGYRWVQRISDSGHTTKVLEPEPVEAERLLAIYHKYLEGNGADSIARWCNSLGWTTKRGSTWSGISIHHLIDHVLTYRGIILCRDESRRVVDMIQGQHPPLIDEALAETIQATHRSRTPANSGGRRAQYPYPLVRLLRCAECGSNIVGSTRNVENGKPIKAPKFYYRCLKDQGACTSSHMRALEIEAQVWAILFGVRDDVLASGGKVAELADVVRPALPEPSGAQAIRAEMDRLNNMYQKGRISEQRYDQTYADLEQKLAMAEASIATIGSVRDPLGIFAFLRLADELEQNLASGTRDKLQALARSVIERVEVRDKQVVVCSLIPELEYLRMKLQA